jgi:purine-binding chemotaxis protein CheW
MQIVGFMLGDEHFGLNIMGVEEIIRLIDITPVPRAPDFVEGIINLRGLIIPVVDLRTRLRISPVAGNNVMIIVARVDDKRLGFIVDKVEEVIHVPTDCIESAPGVSASNTQKYVDGVARTEKGMVIILDIAKIFSPDEKLLLENV